MAEWLRQPTGDEETRGGGGSTATLRWVAVGMLTTKEAIDDANFPIAFNDPHPDWGSGDPRRCSQVRIVANGFKVISVDATFAIPPDNTEFANPEPSQTNPLVNSWSTVQESVAVGWDSANNAYISSARRRVAGITQIKNYKRLTITRWESSYNNTTAQSYENTVNSAAFLGGAVQTVKCSTINPSQNYTALSTLIPIDYTFDFKAVAIWGEKPWQVQYVDEDAYAYANIDGTKRVRIVDANGDPVTALLDGLGRPLDSSLTYIDPATQLPKASPSWVSQSVVPGATIVSMSGGAVKMLRFDLSLPASNFNALGLS